MTNKELGDPSVLEQYDRRLGDLVMTSSKEGPDGSFDSATTPALASRQETDGVLGLLPRLHPKSLPQNGALAKANPFLDELPPRYGPPATIHSVKADMEVIAVVSVGEAPRKPNGSEGMP